MWERVEAANALAFLTELSTELQRAAAITDHLILLIHHFLTDNRQDRDPKLGCFLYFSRCNRNIYHKAFSFNYFK